MNPRLEAANQMFTLWTPVMEKLLANWDDADWGYQMAEGLSSVGWLAGHLTLARSRVLGLAGDPVVLPGWREVLGRGSTGGVDGAPSLADVQRAWADMAPRLTPALGTVTDATLDAPVPQPAPAFLQTTGQFIHHLALHESYHIGQLAFAYKARTGESLLGL